MTTVAILLAAGESTRMGRLKQLLPWAGGTLVDWQVGQLVAAGADEVVVVLGHEAEAVGGGVSQPAARVVVNAHYRQGRASSLRRGAEAVSEPVEAIVVLSVDQPRPAWLTRRLLERRAATAAKVVQPRLGSGRGHPVVLDGALLAELRGVREEDLGLRAVLDRHASGLEVVEVGRPELDVDLNTLEDYKAAYAAFEGGRWLED